MRSAIWKLLDFGQSPWYDNLTRALAQGGLRELLERDGIHGVTSNPTIFEKAMGAGTDYDQQLATLLASSASVEDAYWVMAIDDIRAACDLLRAAHDATDGHDGFVSLEVSPELANDTPATIAQAKELWGRVDRPNLMIKIPATKAGLPAITATIGSGINVNVTLIFSLERHSEVIDAYWSGLDALAASGGSVDRVNSVASFFVSRVDTETDRRLPEGHVLRGKAAVANAKLAYRLFERRSQEPHWQQLAAQGATVQRPLWASTSTKNPAYSPTLYVDELIGRDTVNTLAQASVDALQTHTDLHADSIRAGVEDAEATMAALAAAGVDFDDVTATLEREGVASFQQSFRDVLATLAKKAESLR